MALRVVGCITYKEAVTEAMTELSQVKGSLFLGQTVRWGGSVVYDTVKQIPETQRIELPVAEEMQMGMSIGLALEGFLPVTIYPRIDFLLCAINQLSNHLDILEEMSHGEWKAKVIIRTMIGARGPLYPGPQHCRDHTAMFKALLKTIPVLTPKTPQDVTLCYEQACANSGSTLVIEDANLYYNEWDKSGAGSDDLENMPVRG